MAKMLKFALISIFVIALTSSVDAADCNLPPISTDPKDDMPDIFHITVLSYQMTVEANFAEAKKTMYASEYYDKEEARGRVDTLCDGDDKSFLYFNETKETFTTISTRCTSKELNTVKAPHDEYGAYGWSNPDKEQPIFGPSNLLRDGYVAYKNKQVAKEDKTQTVRGIKTNVWVQCKNAGKLTIRYFFIDKDTESGFEVKDRPVPARITVKGITEDNREIDHTYDIVNYQIVVSHYESVFNIPAFKGCERLVPDEFHRVPIYDGKDFFVEAELVYTPGFTSDTHAYVSNFALMVDAKSGHMAYSSTPFKAHTGTAPAEADDYEELIYDTNNEIVYDLDRSKNTCETKAFDEKTTPRVRFPDDQKLSLFNDDIFITTNNSIQNFHYLGDTRERGLPVSVFERKIETDDTEVIITRYHLTEDTFLDSEFREKFAPIKVNYWRISDNKDDKLFQGLATFNFYAFSSRVTNKPKKFDVTPCFQDDSQSKWIQITFPMGDQQSKDIIPLIPFIQDNFLNELEVIPVRISPLRIPKVIVDVDSEYIYVTALLLERPNFFADFTTLGAYEVQGEDGTLGVMSQSDCARSCLERDSSCKYFSYCGAVCKISKTDPFEKTPKIKDGCQMYRLTKFDTSIPTMKEITTQLALSVEFGSVVLKIATPSGHIVDFPATGFKNGIAFGLEGLTNNPEDSIDTRFKTVKSGFKFPPKVSSEVTPLGVKSYASCKRACLDNPRCQSMSFCMASSVCIISTLHDDEIQEDKLEPNSQCIVLSRTYVDFFQKYPGFISVTSAKKVVEVTNENTCAKACLDMKEFTCLSFDNCPDAEKGRTCLLHAQHFLGIKGEDQVQKSGECAHYSKKLIYDFKVKQGQAITGDIHTTITNLTAEQCAKQCMENSKASCVGFDYCEPNIETTVCTLTSNVKGVINTSPKPSCDVYQRDTTPAALSMPKPEPTYVKPVFSTRKILSIPEEEPMRAESPQPQIVEGYTKSTVGGVSFFLFLIGTAIGVGGMYAFGYYRANRQ